MPRFALWSLLTLTLLGVALPGGALLAADDNEQPAAAENKTDEGADKKIDEDAKEKSEPSKEAAKSDDEKKEEVKKDNEKKDDERKTFTVEPKRLKIEVTVPGTLAAKTMTEIELDAESWSKFEIEEVVPHGARVRAGETLIRFDAEDLNEAIADLELSQRLSELSLIKAEAELPLLEEALERRLKLAQRDWDEAQQDYSQYTDEERDLIVKSQEMRLKQSKFNLDYAKDELDQLQKMYDADDLTEETEELILRRQKTQLEFANFSYEIAKYMNAQTMETTLPRQDVALKEAQRSVEVALERAKLSSQLDLSSARYELEQARIARRKSLEKHSELIADKRLLTIKAPTAGIVYYGRCVDGKWGETAALIKKMLPEKSVPTGAVLMTIVDPSDLELLGAIGEKDLVNVKKGQSAKLELTAEGIEPIDAKVAQVSSVPATPGKFDITVQVTGETPEWLMPGMTGKVAIKTYDKKDALLVPAEAIHTDEDSGKKYVWEVEEEDDEVEVEKEWVKTGKTKGKEVEILKGLEEGDVISLDPKEKGTDQADDDDEDEDDDED